MHRELERACSPAHLSFENLSTMFSFTHGVVPSARPMRSGTAKRATLTKAKASAPSFCQFSFVSRAYAACSATSTLPHSTARLKRVCSSVTKWRATWGTHADRVEEGVEEVTPQELVMLVEELEY